MQVDLLSVRCAMAGGILLLFVVCGIFLFLHIFILPRYILRYRNDYSEVPGRGLERVRDSCGNKVVYEPDRKNRGYIQEYILSERGGRKYLICKTEDAIRYLDYDVLLFGGNRQVFRTLNIREKILRAGFTSEIELPVKTTCASVIVNQADGIKITGKSPFRLSKKWFALYLALCVVLDALGFFAIRFCIANIFAGIFAESYMVDSAAMTNDYSLGWIIIVISLIITGIAVKHKNPKFIKEGKKNAGN